MSLEAQAESRRPRVRRATATARFGSSRRESHDATAFYDRFVHPEVSADTDIGASDRLDVIYRGDSRDMQRVASKSVALVVTSPPYFAGKEYEETLGHNGVPGSYFEYLSLLAAVFAECKRVLEPGGRIAVNVANLGRRPYRSLAGDVTTILQDLGLLMRGEVVWWKGRAAGGSCAWGTFQRPGNPVLRDVTERVVIASKGRFERALTPSERLSRGLPCTPTISRDEFLEATTDLWEIPPESARRVNHPAPFPVELPQRLIGLFTYEGDVVLDPFVGSGTTGVAALRTGRHYIGYDTDGAYCELARDRLKREATRLGRMPAAEAQSGGGLFGKAVQDGVLATEAARALLEEVGFREVRSEVRLPGTGLELSFTGRDVTGATWAFDVSGAFTATRGGLRRADALWKAIGKAAVLHSVRPELPLVLLTTDAPVRGTTGHRALSAVLGVGRPVFDVVELLDPAQRARLRSYASGGRSAAAPA